MNYFKEAEEVLRRLPKLEKALEMLYKQKRHTEKKNSPKGFKDKSIGEGRGSAMKKETLDELCEYSQCLERISATEFEINRIKDILSQLTDEQRTLLKLWYIENKNKELVKSSLNISSLSTLYDLRNRSVSDFALYYFGAKAV